MKIVTYYGRDYRLLWKGCNSRGEDVVALGHIPPRPGRPRHVPCHAIEAIREEECPPEHAVICPFCRIRNYVLQGRREICKMCGISLADGWDLGTVSHPPQRRPITTRHDIMAVAQRQYPDEVDYDGTPLTYGGPETVRPPVRPDDPYPLEWRVPLFRHDIPANSVAQVHVMEYADRDYVAEYVSWRE